MVSAVGLLQAGYMSTPPVTYTCRSRGVTRVIGNVFEGSQSLRPSLGSWVDLGKLDLFL